MEDSLMIAQKHNPVYNVFYVYNSWHSLISLNVFYNSSQESCHFLGFTAAALLPIAIAL